VSKTLLLRPPGAYSSANDEIVETPEHFGDNMNPQTSVKAEPSVAEADLIRATERRRLRALVDADMEVADPLHAADFQLITPGGAARSKEQYMEAIATGAIDYVKAGPESEIAVHLYGEAAAIRYQSHFEVNDSGTWHDARVWHTDIYEKRDGRWQVVWSQATKIVLGN
jgi:hypothetical protein